MDKEKINEQLETKINEILEQGIQPENITILSKLIDIHKDLANEDYWEIKKEGIEMRYRDYNGYGTYGDEYGRRKRDSRGRYMARGIDAKYRGDDMIDEMHEHYGNYMESGGSYGGQESDKAFDYMLQSAEDFFNHLMEEAQNPEQIEKIKRTARRISEMR